ncbi:hypothetical protein EW145_g6777 [Phellinidium pouzarii]|uniref:Uncharacterized protein n=1 Tax=Phellinidium pouzarii TaxID=167371 RepID=A0A4V3XBK0_9AGAM|nr:hypothetical protein EW145_g6777 [Phellinidium pouzarii]
MQYYVEGPGTMHGIFNYTLESYKNSSIRPGQPVGNWRNSNQGMGYGPIPVDVNAVLIPASLRATARLARADILYNEKLDFGIEPGKLIDVNDRVCLEEENDICQLPFLRESILFPSSPLRLLHSNDLNYLYSGNVLASIVSDAHILSSLISSHNRCKRFSLFLPLAGGIVLTMTPDIVIAIRVCALYGRSRAVSFLLVVYLIAELSTAIWIYATPGSHPLVVPPAVQGNNVFHICIEEIASSLGNVRAATFQMMQAIYDTCVFILIVYKALSDKHSRRRHSMLNVIAFHGVIYYAALFSANVTWSLMILFSPAGVKYTPSLNAVPSEQPDVCARVHHGEQNHAFPPTLQRSAMGKL